MKSNIIYFLKHNSIAQFLYKIIFGFLFRLIGLFVKTDDNLVLFLSMGGLRFNDSPKFIYERLVSDSNINN